MANKRIKVKGYRGLWYREVERLAVPGTTEKVFYAIFQKRDENGFLKTHEVRLGKQYADGITPARANIMRSNLIESRIQTPKEKKQQQQQEAKEQKGNIDNLWIEYSNQRKQNDNLRRDRNRYEKHIKPHFGDKKPNQIAPLDIERLKKRDLQGLKPATVRHVLMLLQIIVNYGVNNDLCEPLKFKLKMPVVSNTKDDSLTPEQLTRLLHAIEQDTHIHAGSIMKIALFTGMRRGEILKLKWSDIDFNNNTILLREPKGGKDEIIPLSVSAKEVFNSIIHLHDDCPYVFQGKNGHHISDIGKGIRKIMTAAGIPKTTRPLHSLRHTFASNLVNNGVDLYTVQRLLTHKSSAMTQRYAHIADERLKQAAETAAQTVNQAAAVPEQQELLHLVKCGNI